MLCFPAVDQWKKDHRIRPATLSMHIFEQGRIQGVCFAVTTGLFPGLSMGMGFLWQSHGKRPMGWDGTAHICISHETQK